MTNADAASAVGTEGTGTLAEPQVQAMFDRISRVYDQLNSVMTAGLHHQWRRRAADLAQVGPGSRVLDVATGTGDLAFELAGRVAPGGEVLGVDFAERMLEVARGKAKQQRPSLAPLSFEWANAMELDYPDDSFDAATVAFGVRNFSDIDRGLRELGRVVRGGGHVVILEITNPQRPPLSGFFSFWFDHAVPVLGRVAGDSDAYTYLPSSVRRFPAPDKLAARMVGAGMTEVRYVITGGGIIALHVGTAGPGDWSR